MRLPFSVQTPADSPSGVKQPLKTREWIIEPWLSRVEAIVQLAGWQAANSRPFSSTHADAAPQHIAALALNRYEDQNHYELGRYSLRRLIEYEIAAESPWPEVIRALVELADWDLLYSHNSLAITAYEEAYAELEQAGVRQSTIDGLFSPAMPIVLPVFSPNPLAAGAAPSAEYIDVEFEIRKYGQSRNVRITGATAQVTDADRDSLLRLIKRSRFRPRIANGQIESAANVGVRYYQNERARMDLRL
jgi:hypothetical protein